MKKQTLINAFTVVLLLLASPLWAAPMLSIDSATGVKGTIITVGVNYIADSPAISGGNPVAVKFRINFSPSLVEAGTALAGLSLAGDHVPFSKVDNAAGTVDVVIVPPAKKIALSSGQILQIPFRLKSTVNIAAGGEILSPLTFSLLTMSNDSGSVAVATPISGVLIIKDSDIIGVNEGLSDNFNSATLDETQWLPTKPIVGSSIVHTGSQLALTVPAGEHYFGDINNTLRVMQPIINENFLMQVKFDSLPTALYQMQGILVEENEQNSLRFEIYSDGSRRKLHVASYRNGQSKSLYNEPVAGSPLYLQLERVRQRWSISTSPDGEVWQMGTRFLHDQVANEIGVYVGNLGFQGSTAPAYTALIDDITLYADSTPTARIPQPPDTTDPVISNVSTRVQVGADGADVVISWVTDEPTIGSIAYGDTALFLPFQGTVISNQRGTEHHVTVTGLTEGTWLYYEVTATDGSGNDDSQALKLVPNIPVPNRDLSDAFNATELDTTQWLYVDPIGIGSMNLTGTQLALNVPAGEHYFGSRNDTVRVMQPIVDEDFVAKVKFDSLPTQRYQVQGILVEQDEQNALRFEVYSDGSQLNLYAGRYRNGQSESFHNKAMTGATPRYLRVERVAQQWQFFTSSDDVNWQLVSSFAEPFTDHLVINEVGVYAGNTGSVPGTYTPPAYTALVDEILVYAASTPPPRIPPPLDTTDPVISEIVSSVRAGSDGSAEIIVSWSTDEPTIGHVRYGSTLHLLDGEVATAQRATEQSVTLTGLSADTLYYYDLVVTDSSGNSSTEYLGIMTTVPVPNAGLSDGFNVTGLDATQWLYVDPLGDGSTYIANSQLVLDVPAGEHYFRGSNNTVRVMQPIIDEDFVMDVKFDSLPTQKFQVQGILVEQDEQNMLRFELYSDGDQLYLYAVSHRKGQLKSFHNKPVTASTPLYLRVERVGQQWSVSTSSEGVNWQLASSFAEPLKVNFLEVDPLVINEVGVYAGNTGSEPPAYIALIDDITLYAASTPPLRTPPPVDTIAPVISDIAASVRAGSEGGAEIIVTWTTDEATTGSVAYGETTSYEVGLSPIEPRTTAHSVTLTGLIEDTLYEYQLIVTDSSGNSSTENLSIMTTIPLANAALSDDFNAGTLDATQWLYVNPLADGLMDFTDSQLELKVPAGEHYFRNSNDTVRVMQPIIDENFVMDVKFDSLPTQKFQVQGILVEQDEQNALRFELYSDGDQLYLYAVSHRKGELESFYNAPLAPSTPLYLRVERVGQQWSVSTSSEGVNWQLASSFAEPLKVNFLEVDPLVINEIGVYAGNTGSKPPAYTALIDEVTLYAASTPPARVPDSSGTVTPIPTPAPVINQMFTRVQSVSNRIEVSLNWATDVSTDATVVYGQTTSYEVGYVETELSATEQSMTLTGLLEDTLYYYQVTVTDRQGNSSRTENLSFTTTVPVANEALSDAFNVTALDETQWLYIDPLGEGSMSLTKSLSNEQQLALSVPDGVHYFGSSNETVRLMQPIIDEDFAMQVAFDSLPTQRFQMQGILVEQDVNTALHFEIYSDGNQLKLYAGSYRDGKSASLYNEPLAGTPMYLRLERVAQQWTVFTSLAGSVWQLAFSFAEPFANPLVVNEVGVYVGNTGSESLAYTALIDDIALYAASTPPARTPPPPDTIPPLISDISSHIPAGGGVEVIIRWTSNERTTGSVAYGESTGYELDRIDTGKSTTKHSVTLTGLVEDTLYHYQITATDPSGNSSVERHSVIATPPKPNEGLSDDFNAAVLDDTQWLYVDPLGGGTMSLTDDHQQLALNVPAGEHYFGSSNDTVRIMQRIVDEDFVIKVKFDSLPTQKFQVQGILVEQNVNTWLRFELYSDGDQLKLYAVNKLNGHEKIRYHESVIGSTPMYLRVERVGLQWSVSTSSEGVNWQLAATFTQALVASEIGLYAGNTGVSIPPAYTALIDDITLYAASTPAPDYSAPIISDIKSRVFGTSIELTWKTDELTFGAVEYGQTQAYELGVVDSENGANHSHRVVIGSLEPNSSYNVQIVSSDRSDNQASSQNYVVTTDQVVVNGPIIDAWYHSSIDDNLVFRGLGTPQNWVNILGNVRALNGVQSLTYSLNGSAERPLTVGPNDTRLALVGDFNVDIPTDDLSEGLNTVVVTSTDTLGDTNSVSIRLDYQTRKVWPQEYSIDWANTEAISDVAKVVDGHWQLDEDSVRAIEPGYDRLIAIGDVAWKNYEVTVPITVYALAEDGDVSPSNGPGIGLGMRWPGHTVVDDTQPSIGWHTLGAIGWYRWPASSGEKLMLSGAAGRNNRSKSFEFKLDVTYMFKMRVETVPNQGGRYQLKVWEMGQDEPTGWDLTLQESLADPQLGSLLLIAHEVDARFGNVTIVPINE